MHLAMNTIKLLTVFKSSIYTLVAWIYPQNKVVTQQTSDKQPILLLKKFDLN